MLRRAAPGRHQQMPVAVLTVNQRRGLGLPRVTAGCGQDQSGHVGPDVTLFAVGFQIAVQVVLNPIGWPLAVYTCRLRPLLDMGCRMAWNATAGIEQHL